MKRYCYAILSLLMVLGAGAPCGAQTVYKPYNPYWQWGRADTPRSFVTPGATVLAVRNNRALWGRMSSFKRTGLMYSDPQGDWVLNEYDTLGREIANANTTIQGKVHLISAQADAAGNWYVLGRFYDTALFSVNGPYLRSNPANNVDADHFIVRFDAGTMFPRWITIIGPFADQSSRSFVVDNNRLLLAVDTVNGTRVRAVNTASGAISTVLKQNGASTSTSIQVDATGAIYLAGSCASNGMDFNGATEPPSPYPHSYIVKYRSNGTHIWHHWFRDISCHPRELTLFNNRVLYYSGSMSDSFSIGSLPLQPVTTSMDYVAARLDTAGRGYWARQLPLGSSAGFVQFNAPYHATVTPDTSLVLFAQGGGFIDWQDTLSSNFQLVNASALVSIGYDSHTRWVRDVYADVVMNQHVASEGTAVWISGYARSNAAAIAMDTMRTRTAVNRYSPFMARTRMLRPIPSNPNVGVDETMDGPLRAYPVPARTTLLVEGLGADGKLSLIDMSGRRVLQEAIAGRERVTLDVAELPRGFYVLELLDAAGGRTVRRISLR